LSISSTLLPDNILNRVARLEDVVRNGQVRGSGNGAPVSTGDSVLGSLGGAGATGLPTLTAADTVDGFHAAAVAAPNTLLALDAQGNYDLRASGGLIYANKVQAGIGNDVALLDAIDGTYRLYIGNATAASAPFRVTKAGALTATGATISGTITATAGTIGGWTISSTDLSAGSGSTTVGLDSGGTNPAIYAGSATPGSAPFRVTQAGVVTATSGTVGGWTLGSTTLTGGDATLDSTGILTLGTSNDVIIADATDATYRLWIGNATASSAPFRVSKAGAVTATSGTGGRLDAR